MLLDSHNGLMRFDSSGAYVGGIGALGSQTGEYVNVSSLAFVDDSTVWVVDPGLQRATLYVDGAPHRIIRLQPGSRAIVRYLATRSGVLGLSIPVADSAGSAVVASWGRVSDTGAVVPLQVVPAWALKGADDNFIPELPFFTARPLWAADASGVAYEVPSGSAPAVIVAYTSTGAPRWRATLSMPTRRPTPIEIAREDTARIRHVFRTHADQLLAGCKNSLQIQHCVAVRVEQRYAARAGDPYQVPSAMSGTDGGALWLRGAPLAASDSVDWIMLGSSGQLRGRLGSHCRILFAAVTVLRFWSREVTRRPAYMLHGSAYAAVVRPTPAVRARSAENGGRDGYGSPIAEPRAGGRELPRPVIRATRSTRQASRDEGEGLEPG